VLSPKQREFNDKLSRIRIRVEHCIGMLKARFSSLRGLRMLIQTERDVKRCTYWIRTCATLHNLWLGDPVDEDWMRAVGGSSGGGEGGGSGGGEGGGGSGGGEGGGGSGGGEGGGSGGGEGGGSGGGERGDGNQGEQGEVDSGGPRGVSDGGKRKRDVVMRVVTASGNRDGQ
jgi:DDE superfamily endonuclease